MYNWQIVDLVLDTILEHHCKPFVELGFMPQDLADPRLYDIHSDRRNMELYRTVGWACPPKDYQKWHDLIFQLVRHLVDRHGVDEIRSWYFELWNEPDIFYWRGTTDEFCKLYDYTAAAVKAACPEARVGGPGTTNPAYERNSGRFLDAFLNHCANGTNNVSGAKSTVLDFITFHVKGGGYRADPHKTSHLPSTGSTRRTATLIRSGYARERLCIRAVGNMQPTRLATVWS